MSFEMAIYWKGISRSRFRGIVETSVFEGSRNKFESFGNKRDHRKSGDAREFDGVSLFKHFGYFD